jgi:hypothetical protein
MNSCHGIVKKQGGKGNYYVIYLRRVIIAAEQNKGSKRREVSRGKLHRRRGKGC